MRLSIGLFGLFLAAVANAMPCEKDCSGHGFCQALAEGRSACECVNGWFGPDCSKRDCPSGPAWSDIAIQNEDAHNPMRCSGRGICNFETGTCVCEPGFEGKACERTSCEMNCNGHGKCVSLSRAASTPAQFGGPSKKIKYDQVWDADMIHGCICDKGWGSQYNCALKEECPTGDDPLTINQVNEVKLFACDLRHDVARQLNGFSICWRGDCTDTLKWDDTASTLQTKLNELRTIGEFGVDGVSVTFMESSVSTLCGSKDSSTPTQIVRVEFTQHFGDLEPLVFVTSETNSPNMYLAVSSSSKFFDSTTQVTLMTTFSGSVLVPTVGTKEDIVCSGRGVCNSGVCVCDENFQSSDGNGNAGSRGDCGAKIADAKIGTCIGEMVCSLRGECQVGDDPNNPIYKCLCTESTKGADCSLLSCPKGRAFFDVPSESQKAHALTECSSNGICDVTTGLCTCAVGFEGAACNIMSCPRSCSGHGECLFMSELAELAGYTYGSEPNSDSQWDHSSIKGCQCTEGWEGIACEKQSCPRGPNPVKVDWSLPEIQTVTCSSKYIFMGDLNRPQCFTGPSNYIDVNPQYIESLAYISSIPVSQYSFAKSKLEEALTQCQSVGDWCAAVTEMYVHELPSSYFQIDSDTGEVKDLFLVPDGAFTQSVKKPDHSLRMEKYLPHYKHFQTHDDMARLTRQTYVKQDECHVGLTLGGTFLVELPANSDLNSMTGLRLDQENDALASKFEELRSVVEGKYAMDLKIELSDPTMPLCPHESLGVSNVLTLTFEYAYGDLPELQFDPGSSIGGLEISVSTTQDSTYEYVECSDQGICDHSSGRCSCFNRFQSSDGRGNQGPIENCGYKYEEVIPVAGGGGDGSAGAEGPDA